MANHIASQLCEHSHCCLGYIRTYIHTYLQGEQNTVLTPVQKVLVQRFRELFYLNVQMSVEGGAKTSIHHNNHIDTRAGSNYTSTTNSMRGEVESEGRSSHSHQLWQVEVHLVVREGLRGATGRTVQP